jgi:hypothetical protein
MLGNFILAIFHNEYQCKIAKRLDYPPKSLQYLISKNRDTASMHLLCKMRRASGLRWDIFGKLLEAHVNLAAAGGPRMGIVDDYALSVSPKTHGAIAARKEYAKKRKQKKEAEEQGQEKPEEQGQKESVG